MQQQQSPPQAKKKAFTQLADAKTMERIEARSTTFKLARRCFYEPKVNFDRLSPMMQTFLAKIGERIVKACQLAMDEEARRHNVLAAMPRRAPGYDALARDFELERVRESKVIRKLLDERDQKVAKHTRFAKHIPPPQYSEDHPDDNVWVRAVVDHAAALGIDTKREDEYKLLFLAAESVECPVPPNWEVHWDRPGAEDDDDDDDDDDDEEDENGSGSLPKRRRRKRPALSKPQANGGGAGAVNAGAAPVSAGPRAGVFYYNNASGQSTWEHPLDGYYRSIVAQRKLVRSLERQGRYEAIPRVMEAEETMRTIIEKLLNPRGHRGQHGRGDGGGGGARTAMAATADGSGGSQQRGGSRGGSRGGGGRSGRGGFGGARQSSMSSSYTGSGRQQQLSGGSSGEGGDDNEGGTGGGAKRRRQRRKRRRTGAPRLCTTRRAWTSRTSSGRRGGGGGRATSNCRG